MARKRLTLVATSLTAAAVLGIGGAAYAVFTSETPADANGAAATMSALKVVGAPAIDYAGDETALWPNVNDAHVATVVVEVANPNEVAVRVDSSGVSNTLLKFKAASVQERCGGYLTTTEALTLDSEDGSVLVPAKTAEGDGTGTVRIKGVVLSVDAPNGCQGQQFQSKWKITGVAQ